MNRILVFKIKGLHSLRIENKILNMAAFLFPVTWQPPSATVQSLQNRQAPTQLGWLLEFPKWLCHSHKYGKVAGWTAREFSSAVCTHSDGVNISLNGLIWCHHKCSAYLLSKHMVKLYFTINSHSGHPWDLHWLWNTFRGDLCHIGQLSSHRSHRSMSGWSHHQLGFLGDANEWRPPDKLHWICRRHKK